MEAPCFSRGEMDFSPAEKASMLKWALAPVFLGPSAKAHNLCRTFPGALKRSYPRINAGASTKGVLRGSHRRRLSSANTDVEHSAE